MNIKTLFKTQSLNTSVLDMSRAARRRLVNAKPVPANMAVAEVDHIPIEVANAMLFTPGTKLTSRMRKNCMAARETVLVSTLEAKTYEQRILAKAHKATHLQLLKWTRRAAAKGAEVFRDYARLRRNVAKLDPMKLQEHAKANRILKIMEIEQERIDSELHAYSTEAQRRLTAGEVR